MRIPDARMAYLVGDQLAQTSDRLAKLQIDVSSGVCIRRPSDDPEGAQRALELRSGLARVEQYQSTANDASSWLKTEDSALGSMQTLIRQVRDYALQGNNPLSTESRNALGAQIDAVKKSLMQVANTSDGTRYVFGGFQTLTPPLQQQAGSIQYTGDQGAMTVMLGDDMPMQLNTNGAALFNMGGAADASSSDLFATLDTLSQAVRSGDQTTITSSISDLDTHATRIATARGTTGIRLQQVNLALDRLAQSQDVMNESLTNTEGTDLTSAIVELKTQENVQQAVSYVASNLSRGGLLSWLR